MRFMVLVHPGNMKEYEAGAMPSKKMMSSMNSFNKKLEKAGVLISLDGLQPSSKGIQVKFSSKGNKKIIGKGPFIKTQDLIGGYWVWKVNSKEEALAWAKRAPMEKGATLELRQIFEASDFK